TKQTFLLAQTTVSHDQFLAIKEFFQARITNLKVQDTTCRVIRNREQQVRDFARQNDVVLFVGGKDSSNTKELFHICLRENKNTYHIEEGSEIEPRWLQGVQSVGITGGASTPRWQLEKIKDSLARMILEI
ncbi:MAG: 4-hydroxy-3-methylbut-2-enyl diphosphate reductase, partial [candidate division KSB1 bacterium]|nr:4-hydroxy-3-methylbut-2-enyl diphosphate reductase [candidate division KSB1 bacterium]